MLASLARRSAATQVKASLAVLERLQFAMERSADAVDAELRSVLPPPPQLNNLPARLKDLARSCAALNQDVPGLSWVPYVRE